MGFGSDGPVVASARRSHVRRVGEAAVGPIGFGVVHLGVRERDTAVVFAAAPVLDEGHQPLRLRRETPAAAEEQGLVRDVAEHREVGLRFSSELDDVIGSEKPLTVPKSDIERASNTRRSPPNRARSIALFGTVSASSRT
ncbi:MAG: hypothetical protein NTW76_10745 [Corynebacteriales bacterium]|nr:hypothetical protein [Mycobacteriales bacterium]